MSESNTRIESKLEIQCYLQNLRYALDNGAKLNIQIDRRVDQNRNIRYTNRFTLSDLFPDEDPSIALKQELKQLTVENYIQTVKDNRFEKKSEMREFGKYYCDKGDVYIKIRAELLADNGNHFVFVMSFHYAERPFTDATFPYRNNMEA